MQKPAEWSREDQDALFRRVCYYRKKLPRQIMEDPDSTTTRLLTLLNVSATKAGKRKWAAVDDFPSKKLNKRKTARFATVSSDAEEVSVTTDIIIETPAQSIDTDAAEFEPDVEGAFTGIVEYFLLNLIEGVSDAYETHFGRSPSLLSE